MIVSAPKKQASAAYGPRFGQTLLKKAAYPSRGLAKPLAPSVTSRRLNIEGKFTVFLKQSNATTSGEFSEQQFIGE